MKHFVTLFLYLLNQRNNLSVLVNEPFIQWHKKSEYLSAHARKQDNIDEWNAAMDFINKTKNPPSTIPGRTQPQSKENYETNAHILK